MKKLFGTACVSLSLLVAAPVVADELKSYVGLNYAQIEQHSRDTATFGDRVETGDVIVRVGADITSWFSAELRFGSSVAEEKTGDDTFRSDLHVAAMAKLIAPWEGFRPYVGIGYVDMREQYVVGGVKTKFHEREAAYAAGVDLHLSESFGINLEMLVHSMDPSTSMDRKGPSAGFFFRF